MIRLFLSILSIASPSTPKWWLSSNIIKWLQTHDDYPAVIKIIIQNEVIKCHPKDQNDDLPAECPWFKISLRFKPRILLGNKFTKGAFHLGKRSKQKIGLCPKSVPPTPSRYISDSKVGFLRPKTGFLRQIYEFKTWPPHPPPPSYLGPGWHKVRDPAGRDHR